MADVTARETPVVDDLGQALNALLLTYLGRAREAVADVPGGPRGFQVLQLSQEQACTNQAGMAAALRLDRTVMTYLVDDLEKAGLIERQPDPADRRARRVVITESGRAALASARVAIREVERETISALDDAEAAQLRALLTKAAQGIDHDTSACEAAGSPPTC
ncbi:MarR family winged helix-turn-helix transcriptional regulator [Aeromicrobium sp. Root495]|uniref:MarR family winged helix-turn-helix transcriptional regulator n=1 Tax=Aeromicrobium sp. Root495 TaxID=1736550 RepID=UPI000B0BFACA|nr:MarR family transcriptional regulator [Aeromicrobium sp. Root495]